eukprot:Pgem_evm1s3767
MFNFLKSHHHSMVKKSCKSENDKSKSNNSMNVDESTSTITTNIKVENSAEVVNDKSELKQGENNGNKSESITKNSEQVSKNDNKMDTDEKPTSTTSSSSPELVTNEKTSEKVNDKRTIDEINNDFKNIPIKEEKNDEPQPQPLISMPPYMKQKLVQSHSNPTLPQHHQQHNNNNNGNKQQAVLQGLLKKPSQPQAQQHPSKTTIPTQQSKMQQRLKFCNVGYNGSNNNNNNAGNNRIKLSQTPPPVRSNIFNNNNSNNKINSSPLAKLSHVSKSITTTSTTTTTTTTATTVTTTPPTSTQKLLNTGNTAATDNQSYLTDPNVRPPFSYATLIARAIMADRNQCKGLIGIYDYIGESYPFYKETAHLGRWQNSVRHNLSLNECFRKKIGEGESKNKKKVKWEIDEKCKHYFSEDGTYIKSNTGRKAYETLLKEYGQPLNPVIVSNGSNCNVSLTSFKPSINDKLAQQQQQQQQQRQKGPIFMLEKNNNGNGNGKVMGGLTAQKIQNHGVKTIMDTNINVISVGSSSDDNLKKKSLTKSKVILKKKDKAGFEKVVNRGVFNRHMITHSSSSTLFSKSTPSLGGAQRIQHSANLNWKLESPSTMKQERLKNSSSNNSDDYNNFARKFYSNGQNLNLTSNSSFNLETRKLKMRSSSLVGPKISKKEDLTIRRRGSADSSAPGYQQWLMELFQDDNLSFSKENKFKSQKHKFHRDRDTVVKEQSVSVHSRTISRRTSCPAVSMTVKIEKTNENKLTENGQEVDESKKSDNKSSKSNDGKNQSINNAEGENNNNTNNNHNHNHRHHHHNNNNNNNTTTTTNNNNNNVEEEHCIINRNVFDMTNNNSIFYNTDSLDSNDSHHSIINHRLDVNRNMNLMSHSLDASILATDSFLENLTSPDFENQFHAELALGSDMRSRRIHSLSQYDDNSNLMDSQSFEDMFLNDAFANLFTKNHNNNNNNNNNNNWYLALPEQ